MGGSLYPTDADACEQLCVNADKNRILYFNYEMKEEFEKQHMLEQQLNNWNS